MLLVIPELFKQINIAFAHRIAEPLGKVISIVSPFAAKPYRSKFVERHIGILILISHDIHESGDNLVGGVGLECSFLANPLGTLSGDGSLRQFVAQPHFKLSAVKALLAIQARDIEFTLRFLSFIGRKGWRGKYKFQFIDVGKALFQFFVGID